MIHTEYIDPLEGRILVSKFDDEYYHIFRYAAGGAKFYFIDNDEIYMVRKVYQNATTSTGKSIVVKKSIIFESDMNKPEFYCILLKAGQN